MLSILGAGCSTFAIAPADPVCGEIAKFANSATDDEPHTVELITDWGDFSKTCEHGGYAAGETLCDWLLENTSTEFAQLNFRHAYSCLRGPSGNASLKGPLFDNFSGTVSSFEAKHVRSNIDVELEFFSGTKDKLPSFKITAQRWSDL
jgi:hypothetical protein